MGTLPCSPCRPVTEGLGPGILKMSPTELFNDSLGIAVMFSNVKVLYKMEIYNERE